MSKFKRAILTLLQSRRRTRIELSIDLSLQGFWFANRRIERALDELIDDGDVVHELPNDTYRYNWDHHYHPSGRG